jgi:hypothetical protein
MKSELQPIRKALIDQGKDITRTRILAQRNDDVDCLNEAWFNLENERVDYKDGIFYPGSVIRFLKNVTFKKRSWTKQIECSPVANNTTARIAQIYDINPKGKYETAYAKRKMLKSSSQAKSNYQWYRVFEFDDGTKINLNDYHLNWITYGYASTIASAQGSESANIIVWIQPSWNFIYNETLYTAMTRARETVYIICSLNGDPRLIDSDIGKIQRHYSPTIENTLDNYIPTVITTENEQVEIPKNLLPVIPLWNEDEFDDLNYEDDDDESANNDPNEEDQEDSDDDEIDQILGEVGQPFNLGLSRTLSADGFDSPKRTKLNPNEHYTEIEDTNARW